MIKKLLPMVVLVFYPSYSYCDSVNPYYGVTGNAAAGGHSWSMDNIFPEPPGLDVNTIIYSYTPKKDPLSDMKVHVQNENASGSGYIFRETDDWSGQPGDVEIRKVVPVIPNIPKAAWGKGSIEVEGSGTVEDATVLYSYKIDPCFNSQHDPSCPGYKVPVPDIPEIDLDSLYDATQDEFVNLSSDEKLLLEENKETVDEELEEDEEEEEKRKREYRLQMLADTNAAELFAQNQRIEQMNQIAQAQIDTSYLTVSIPGGVYNDTLSLEDTILNDNRQGLRNGLAQQLLHEKMVSMQYAN